jgi:hypothetical protein
MTVYGGLQSVLNGALDKYAAQGFTLVEEEDDFLVMYHRCETHKNHEVFRALQGNNFWTPAQIQCECEAHLTSCHGIGGISFEKEAQP